jgi:hypothetical protein
MLHALVKLRIAFTAANLLSDYKSLGFWELVLGTPLERTSLARRIVVALRKSQKGAWALLFCVDVLVGIRFFLQQDFHGTWVVAATLLVLISDYFALPWVAVFQALRQEEATRAATLVFAQCSLVRWVLLLPAILLFGINHLPELVGVWLGAGLVFNHFFALNARQFLSDNFEQVAMPNYLAHQQQLQSEWSPMNWDA